MSTEQAPIKVALFGMDDRAYNGMAVLLKHTGKDTYRLVSAHEQQVAIVDLDGVGSERMWLDIRRKFSGPAIVLSVQEKTLRNSIWVKKPINKQSLLDALAKARGMGFFNQAAASAKTTAPTARNAVTPPAPASRSVPPAAGRQAHPVPEEKSAKTGTNQAASQIKRQPSIHECCDGLAAEIYQDASRRDRLYFERSQSLLGIFDVAIEQMQRSQRPVLVAGLGRPLLFLPENECVRSELKPQYLRPLSTIPRTNLPIKITVLDDTQVANNGPADTHSTPLDSFIWQIALWSARGRVPQGTPIDQPVKLKNWPNLTRWADVPGAMQMSALWVQQPTSVMAMARQLGLPYHYVFSFYTACLALDLIVPYEGVPLEDVAGQGGPVALSEGTKAKRGLFARMLNNLGF